MLRWCWAIIVMLLAMEANAQRTELALINDLVEILQYRDTIGYTKLFPKDDSFHRWQPLLMAHASRYQAPPHYLNREEAALNFVDIIKRGRAEEIHWKTIVLMRYELEEASDGIKLGRDSLPFSVFQGYIFIRDQKTGKVYTLSMANMIVARGKWYCGEIVSVLQASTKEEFLKKLKEEKELLKKMASGEPLSKDSTGTDEEEKEIVERKFYKGWFDDDVEVQFYVQHIKGDCPEPACTYEALFKFGDDEWVKMSGTKDTTGKWTFTEEAATMELTLDSEIYTGIWSAGPTQSEYEASMKESPLSPSKAKEYDEMIRSGIPAE